MNTTQMVQKFVSGSVLRSINFVLAALIGFFMLPFLVHALGDEHYGLWILVGSIMGFYGMVDFGLSTAISRYVASSFGKRDYEQITKIVNTSIVLYGCLGLAIILFTFVGVSVYSLNKTETPLIVVLLIILAINLGIQFPLRSFSGILTAQMRFELPVYVDLFKLISRTILIVLFISQGFGVISLAMITLIVETIGGILLFMLIRRNAKFITFGFNKFDKTIIKPLFMYSWAVFATNISETGRLKVIPIFVSSTLGLTYTTLYGIAIQLINYYENFMKLAILGLMSAISRFEGEGNNDLIWKTFHYATVLNVLTAIFIGSTLLMYGKTFIILWIGEKYTHSFTILVILTIPFMLSLMQGATKETLLALSKQTIYAIISACSLVGIVIACLIIGSSTNINSIAYAALFGMLVPECIKPIYVAKALNVKIMDAYKIYMNTIVRAGSILWIYWWATHNYVPMSYTGILISLIGQTIFFVGLSYFFILPLHLQQVLKRAIIGPMLTKVRSRI